MSALMRMRERDGRLYFPTCDVPLTPADVEEQYNVLVAEVERLILMVGMTTDSKKITRWQLLDAKRRSGCLVDGETEEYMALREHMKNLFGCPRCIQRDAEDAIAVAELNGGAE